MDAKKLLEEFQADETIKQQYRPLFQDCYELTLPNRRGFEVQSEGARRTQNIYDSTAVVGLQNFASQIQAGLTPNFTRWCNFEAGSEISEEQEGEVNVGLEKVRDYFFEILDTSNFSAVSHEFYIDLGISTGAMLIEEGTISEPLRFVSVPLTDFVLGVGAYDTIARISRPRCIKAEDVPIRYPKAKLPKEMEDIIRANPKKEVNLVEIVRRDETARIETHDYYLLWKDKSVILEQYTWKGEGSCPWVISRWSQASGETYGRGPVSSALGDIKTANLTVQMVLQNAEMAIAGLYKMEDDGVINVDTIQVAPGAVIPYQMGTKGIDLVGNGSNFNVADLLLSDVRENIRRALFDQPLGSPDKTPMKAAEVQARMGDLARRIGSSYGRLQYEFVQKLVARCMYILRKKGLVKVPKINGREVRVIATSPLARQQNYQDVEAISNTSMIIQQAFGPQVANIVLDAQKGAEAIANKLGAPAEIVRSEEDRKAIVEGIAAMAQTAAQNGEMPQ